MHATTPIRTLLTTCGLAAAMLAAPQVAGAQTSPDAPPAHQQMVTANPFGLMFEWFNAEYERLWRPDLSWGVQGSFFSLDAGEVDYANAGAFCRYYPQGTGLQGFFVGGRLGVYRIANEEDAAGFMGFGFDIGYTWLLGRERHFAISLGAGATRLFGGSLDGVSLTVPSIRLLNLGVAF